MEEEENRHPPVRDDSARGGEKPATEPSLDEDWDQSGAFCAGQVIILKALQQAVGSGLAGELQDPAGEKEAECKCTSRRKWCRSSRSERVGGSWLGTGDPALVCDRGALMSEVPEAPAAAVVPALAGVLDYLELTCHLPEGVESSIGTQVAYGDEDMEEVELVAEVRLEDVGALSGILRRSRSWRMQKSVTALLFKMEEANLASRAKAQELIQATNQILTHTKPSASLGPTQPPAPPTLPPPSHLAVPPVSYLLQSALPLGGCGSTPTTPTPGTLSQAPSGPPSAGIFASSSGTDLGSTSSEGRGDSDKYLKKLHTQERAVEEVKLAIKPYYQKKEISKEEYKDILRKAVHKICHSKSGEINPVKVNNLVKAYVQRYKYFRKHGRKMDDEPGPPKEMGLDKSGLPMPPL